MLRADPVLHLGQVWSVETRMEQGRDTRIEGWTASPKEVRSFTKNKSPYNLNSFSYPWFIGIVS